MMVVYYPLIINYFRTKNERTYKKKRLKTNYENNKVKSIKKETILYSSTS